MRNWIKMQLAKDRMAERPVLLDTAFGRGDEA